MVTSIEASLEPGGLDALRQVIREMEQRVSNMKIDRRVILGIAGIPGSGKSTIAKALVDAINHEKSSPSQAEKNSQADAPYAVLVPMDGFHFPNAYLDANNLRSRKGSPPTFDVRGYVELLRRAKASSPGKNERLNFPIYDRALHEPVLRDEPAQTIAPGTKIIITEGNYLLLNTPPWSELGEIFDACWFVQTPLEKAEKWIIQRHIKGGRSAEQAAAFYQSNDLVNAKLVIENQRKVDVVVRWI